MTVVIPYFLGVDLPYSLCLACVHYLILYTGGWTRRCMKMQIRLTQYWLKLRLSLRLTLVILWCRSDLIIVKIKLHFTRWPQSAIKLQQFNKITQKCESFSESLFGVKSGLRTINWLFRSNLMMMLGNYDNGLTGIQGCHLLCIIKMITNHIITNHHRQHFLNISFCIHLHPHTHTPILGFSFIFYGGGLVASK